MSELDRADELMKAGEKEAAQELLRKLLQESPTKKDFCQDAVGIHLEGAMYQEAKEVFDLDRQRTGKELTGTDWTLTDIEHEEREATAAEEQYAQHGVKVFRRNRLIAFLRSPLPHWGIHEIQIDDDRLILKRGWHAYRYRWSDIHEVSIAKRWVAARSADVIKEMCLLKTADQIFTFDVSVDSADFTHTDILLRELRKHLAIKEGKPRESARTVRLRQQLIAVVLLVLLFLFKWLRQ